MSKSLLSGFPEASLVVLATRALLPTTHYTESYDDAVPFSLCENPCDLLILSHQWAST